jgi:hypothetical protein
MQKKMVRFIYIILGVVFILVLALPGSEHWMLSCPFYKLTGWQCPFCGGQRMLRALLYGNLYDAFVLNPFLFCSIPLFIIYMCRHKLFSDKWLLVYLILALLWGIFRNIYICTL